MRFAVEGHGLGALRGCDIRQRRVSVRWSFGRGGGDRKDKLLNKACALNALQPLPLSNWNKRNRHQDESALGADRPTPTAPFIHLAPLCFQ
jgi:hypothetical protein